MILIRLLGEGRVCLGYGRGLSLCPTRSVDSEGDKLVYQRQISVGTTGGSGMPLPESVLAYRCASSRCVGAEPYAYAGRTGEQVDDDMIGLDLRSNIAIAVA